MKKSFISLLLSIIVCLFLVPCAALAAQEPAEVRLPISVSVSGEDSSPSETYTFRISAIDDAPLPNNAISFVDVSINGAGTLESDPIVYDRVGIYRYTITQLEGGNDKCHYDLRTYDITITVTNSGDGSYLEATLAASDSNVKSDKIIFENKYDPVPHFGNLMISKTVTGELGDKSRYFYFTVTFDASGSYGYTGSREGEISSGGSIKLRHGESVTISGLPASTKYSVVESENAGYTVTSSGDTGIIQENATSNASFINNRSKVPDTGDKNKPAFWSILMLISLAVVTGSIFFKKKSNKSK